jgi:hypothetical protein
VDGREVERGGTSSFIIWSKLLELEIFHFQYFISTWRMNKWWASEGIKNNTGNEIVSMKNELECARRFFNLCQ